MDLEDRVIQLTRDLTKAKKEIRRLQGWLEKIEGGDSQPCYDDEQLRRWAWMALCHYSNPDDEVTP